MAEAVAGDCMILSREHQINNVRSCVDRHKDLTIIICRCAGALR
jgi:hypothetical protein